MRTFLLIFMLGIQALTLSYAQSETQYLPHYTFVNNAWQTHLSLSNASGHQQKVAVAVFGKDGSQLDEKTLTLPALGGIRGDIEVLFPNLAQDSGWLTLNAESTDITGTVRFTHKQTGGSTTLPLTNQAGKRLVMADLENSEAWAGGLALVNTGNQKAVVVLEAQAFDGRPLTKAQISVPAGAKWVGMLNDVFDPEELMTHQTIVVSSDQVLTGFALNFANGLEQIVAVPMNVVSGQAPQMITKGQSIQGTWRQRGHGNYLSVDEDELVLLQGFDSSCLYDDTTIPFETVNQGLLEVSLLGDGRLFLETAFDQVFFFEPTNQMPTATCDFLVSPDNDPFVNFDAFWRFFDKHYVFFDLQNFNPETLKETYRARLQPNMSNEALALLFVEMLSHFQDSHVAINTPFGSVEADPVRGYQQELRQLFEAQTEVTDFGVFLGNDINKFVEVSLGYLNESSLRAGANGKIAWGTLRQAPEIGYLAIYQMLNYGDGDIELEEDLAILNQTLDRAFTDLTGIDKLVVDIRINGGGFDQVSKAIAQRLAHKPRRTHSKAALDGQGLAPFHTVWLDPYQGGARFEGGEIVLLTSERTVSAAEIFTLMMRSLPEVTHVGEPTLGGFSDVLAKPLPNGWSLELSNEVYLDRNGKLWEGMGVTPQEIVGFYRQADRQAGKDSGIERAVEILQNR